MHTLILYYKKVNKGELSSLMIYENGVMSKNWHADPLKKLNFQQCLYGYLNGRYELDI